MRALTFINPFAAAALTVKPYDNRRLPPPKGLIGQRIAIHAGKKYDDSDQWGLIHKIRVAWHALGRPLSLVEPDGCTRSAIIGTVLLRGYVSRDTPESDEWSAFGIEAHEVPAIVGSGWLAEGSRCLWVFGEPRELRIPISMKGSQGFWTVPEQYVAALEAL